MNCHGTLRMMLRISPTLSPSLSLSHRPIPSNELLKKICQVCGDDHSAVALTQEILVYLSMFVRSEPELFQEVLRLRIGLIQNVMVSELSRTMMCSGLCVGVCTCVLGEGGGGRRERNPPCQTCIYA